VGEGSGRLVFQIDDEKVLKLAKNQAGVAQNKQESRAVIGKKYPGLFPKVFREMSDLRGYSYIVSEYVLPATMDDFTSCLGISYPTFDAFIRSCLNVN